MLIPMPENLVILAGGASSRMKKSNTVHELSSKEVAQANERSKSLIGVGPQGRPLLDYLLYNAKTAGYQTIYILISEEGELFKQFYGEQRTSNALDGLDIKFAVQYLQAGRQKPLGTADALFQTVQQFPQLKTESYTVCNSDNLYSLKALLLLRRFNSSHAFISYDRDALQFPARRISQFAIVLLDETNFLLNIIEKPTAECIESCRDSQGKLRVSMNAFKFQGSMIFPYLEQCPLNPVRNEKELPTALLNMAKDHPRSVSGIPLSEHVPDLTAKEDIVAVKEYLKQYYPQWD